MSPPQAPPTDAPIARAAPHLNVSTLVAAQETLHRYRVLSDSVQWPMSTCLQFSFFLCGAPVPIVPARIPSLSRNMLRQNQSAAMRAPLAELHPPPSSTGQHPQSGGCEDRVLA